MKGAKKEGGFSKGRVWLVVSVFVLLFSAVLYKAFSLQVLDQRGLKKMALNQHNKTLNVQSKRGAIYDRNLKELAVSIEVDSVYAEPSKMDAPKAAVRSLSRILSVDNRELEKRLGSSRNFVWLKRQVDLKEEERQKVTGIEGVGVRKESRRYYPNKQLASNLIGFTGVDANGLEGVELYYDGLLKGSSTRITGEKDALGRTLIFEDSGKKVPIGGMEVELTIDKTIQYHAERSLKKAIESSGAKGGTAVVMNPATGEVLAMASLPTFDPNDIKGYAPRQWKNKPIADTFEPGSVLKLFLISAAIEENAISPGELFFCENGKYKVADRTFHDIKGYGWLSAVQIIKYSSNIGSAKIGERLGKARLYRYLKSFGFGEKTGIDLPGETAGAFRHFKGWSGVTLQTVSFGQGISVTAIQLASALSTVANGGFLMKPYVVKAVRDLGGNAVNETNPVIVRRVISEKTAKRMTEMLIGVTETGGTGTRAKIDGFEVAGKTGTAQKADLKNGGYHESAYTATFMGFVPARSPKLAIVVVLDEPKGEHHGGVVSAPAFKEIAQASLAYMGIFPDLPGGAVNPAVKAGSESGTKAGVVASELESVLPEKGVPDFTGKTVRNVIKIAKEKSLDVNVTGSGKAVLQKPGPGKAVPADGRVAVWFQ
ncbi:PASTA domain-containing protein [bacterium]|nr:MAG: PASTA domain-containing protein [bacterium]